MKLNSRSRVALQHPFYAFPMGRKFACTRERERVVALQHKRAQCLPLIGAKCMQELSIPRSPKGGSRQDHLAYARPERNSAWIGNRNETGSICAWKVGAFWLPLPWRMILSQ